MKKQVYFVLEMICGFIAVVALIGVIATASGGNSSSAGALVGGVIFWGLMFLLAWNAHKKASQ